MFLFEPPPPTRYDLRFAVAGIPVRVHPLFWLMALLLGGWSGNPLYLLLWIAAVFVSILVHELGHAFVARWRGQAPQIVLHLFGGLTLANRSEWGERRKAFLSRPLDAVLGVLAGPLSGFLLAGLIMLGARLAGGQVILVPWVGGIRWPQVLLPLHSPLVNSVIGILLWVNLFWGCLNLMPVYPLDGGLIVYYLWVHFDPIRGTARSLTLSFLAAGLIAMTGLFVLRSTYIVLLFGILAFQSYRLLNLQR